MSNHSIFTVLNLFLNCDNLTLGTVLTIYDKRDNYYNSQSNFLYQGLIKQIPLAYLSENVERFRITTDGLRCDVLIC